MKNALAAMYFSHPQRPLPVFGPEGDFLSAPLDNAVLIEYNVLSQ